MHKNFMSNYLITENIKVMATKSSTTLTSSTSKEFSTKKMEQQQSAIPHIEVVNEIQIVVSNKRDNPRSLNLVTTPNDSKDIKKCVSSRSSKTDLTAITTPTTATLDVTSKNVMIAKNEKRLSKSGSEKEKSETGSTICVCGKLLKRVKELLEAKETKANSKSFI